MAYTKIDWTTWTKAAMAQTIETLMSRQTSLLNRIAELEAHQVGARSLAHSFTNDPNVNTVKHEYGRTVEVSLGTLPTIDWNLIDAGSKHVNKD